jgi:hypothetical protein
MALAAPVLDQTYRYPYQSALVGEGDRRHLRVLDDTLSGAGVAPPVEAGAALDRFAALGGQAGRLARSILSRG